MIPNFQILGLLLEPHQGYRECNIDSLIPPIKKTLIIVISNQDDTSLHIVVSLRMAYYRML